MGYYVNPKDQSKGEFLAKYPRFFSAPQWPLPEGQTAVCLVNNSLFTAAGICHSEAELNSFNEPGDYRPKLWFIVPTVDLAPWWTPGKN